MSLRDALLKSGAVSKKQAQASERQARRERKKKRGNRKKKKVEQAAAAATAAAEDAAAFAERVAKRRALHAAQEAAARKHRARQLIRMHGLEEIRGGPVRFHHRGLSGDARLHRLELPWSVARALREGRMAIAGLTHPFFEQIEYWVVPSHVADRLAEVQPSAIVYRNAEPLGEEPELRFIDEDCARTPWDGEGPFRWSQPEQARRWGGA